MQQGWIKLYRDIEDWRYFSDAKTLQLFLCIFAYSNKTKADENENMFILVQKIEKRNNKRLSIFVCW